MRLRIAHILSALLTAASAPPTWAQSLFPTKTVHIKTDMDNGAVLETIIAEDDLDRLVVYFRDPIMGSDCSAEFDDASKHTTDSADVKCDGKVVGMLTLKALTDREGINGYLELKLGSTGWFTVQKAPPPIVVQTIPEPSVPTTPAPVQDEAAVSDPQPAYPEPYAAPVPSMPGCVSENAYGATSCITGLPRTRSVQGYTRSNGTYVQPYVRSHR